MFKVMVLVMALAITFPALAQEAGEPSRLRTGQTLVLEAGTHGLFCLRHNRAGRHYFYSEVVLAEESTVRCTQGRVRIE